MNKFILAIAALIILTAPALAAEEPYTYAPEDCEFTATFPEKPQKTRKCDTDRPDSCYDSISFARVFDLSTSVNIRLTCNPITQSVADQYTQGIMKGTLDVMARRDQVGAYEIRYREEEAFKQAGYVGEGKVGRTPAITIGQLWIGKSSAFTVEAQLIGNQHQGADALFSDILRSIRYKNQKPAEENAEEKAKSESEEKPEEKAAEETEEAEGAESGKEIKQE